MIKWPEKSKHNWNPSKIESDRMDAREEGWDDAIDACIASEKEGRMGVEEIRKIIRPLFDRFSKNGIMMLRDQANELSDDIAQAIHKALYGESEKEK